MRRSNIIFVFFALFQVCVGQKCTDIGPQCDASCNIAFCPAVDLDPIVIVNCAPTEKFCQKNTTTNSFECSAERCNSPNAPHPFKCLMTGQLPDPYDTTCKKSYFCGSAGSAPLVQCECGESEIFDAATSACISGTACPAGLKPPECKSLGEQGKWADFCFICDEEFNAGLYRCPTNTPTTTPASLNEEKFSWSARAQSCKPYEPPNASSSTAPSSPTTPSTTAARSSSTSGTSSSETPTSTTPGSTSPGSPSTSEPTSTSPATTSSSSSSPTSSSSPSTPTSSPTSTSPSTPTTSPTSTTSPSTSTAPPKPNGTCVAPNQRLPDPNNCRNYFICNSNLEPILKVCPINYRYDTVRLACVRGTC